MKQQLRDSQVEVTQKLSELFQLKTQLRETRTELRNQEGQIDALKLVLRGSTRLRCPSQDAHEDRKGGEESLSAGAAGNLTYNMRVNIVTADVFTCFDFSHAQARAEISICLKITLHKTEKINLSHRKSYITSNNL